MKIMFSKAVVLAVIVLFVGAGAVPSTGIDIFSLNAGNTFLQENFYKINVIILLNRG